MIILGENLSVPYDSQEQVYTQMLKELEEADKVLEENKDLSSEAFRKLRGLVLRKHFQMA